MLSGKILKLHGWPEGKVIGLAKAAAARLEAGGMSRESVLEHLGRVRDEPEAFAGDPVCNDLALECARLRRQSLEPVEAPLRAQPLNYRTWGADGIDAAAGAQMDAAMRLPVSVAGALMPDAHVGYGLPIGGVLAVEDAVIPFAVGVDIACRMRLSLYEVEPGFLAANADVLQRALQTRTQFGAGASWQGRDRADHEVLDDPAWDETRLLKSLRDKAHQQLGTSGTGNHFVEWGMLDLSAADPALHLAAGCYLALLSHSGSRAVGFKIANAYSKIAEEAHPKLDQRVRRLAWLSLDSEAGQEYWLSMELAGRFASANHAVIHKRVAAAAGLKEAASVENHHNFAWRETVVDEKGAQCEAIVHRKGATPAGIGVLGVIPGSMADAGYVVRGHGVPASLNSASHGAGRAMSRRAALERITKTARDQYLRERGIVLLGGGLDEAPQAYKRIEEVIAAQADLVEILGTFTPKIVRMADEPGDI
jgi:tRNA-splicing ligase RtcB